MFEAEIIAIAADENKLEMLDDIELVDMVELIELDELAE